MGSEQRNALMAVVLSGAILFGWQYFFAPPKPAATAPIEPTAKTQPVQSGTTATSETTTAGPIEPVADEMFSLSSNGVTVTFDNSLTVTNFENPQAAFDFNATVGKEKPMRVEFDFGNGFHPIRFAKTAEANKYFSAENDVTLVTGIDEKGRANFALTSTKPFKYRFVYDSVAKKLENGQERFFSFFTDKLNKHLPGDEDGGDRAIKWAGIDFNYHLFGTYFDKEQSLIYKNGTDNTFSMFSNKPELSLTYHMVFVKKEYNYLTDLGHQLNKSVDFGWWGIFAVWILKGLQFFHNFTPNYGICIILLTLVVRLITFPLQYKSFVSMKKLQLVQPELTKIREKFKDDPARMQKESMELFRKSGANPLGGCLPLLLQMPVFFAFYKVLYSAVELVDAPFFGWIQDLSNKDPYFVLPVLMTVAMFFQQKLTPNTIQDPVQKKIMLFMPLVFGFIMKDLPSGLSLYIFVSTVFGILQQLMVFNVKTKNTPVVV
ncbi:membrane protein insertase YidC [Peredibacter sp. HCB2-198]|uniref:membrane protein insertase YidC n=1 Tax=Peredibacter sp. HCB2-198 TaxID=3383025 RepID=UPI0038B63C78